MDGCISFATLNGMPALDIDIKAPYIQLYITSSFRTLIELFTNSMDGGEKTNMPMPKEFALGTLARIITRLNKVYKIKDKFQLKLIRRKIQIEFNGLRWNL
jgi:hypothetical protein